MGRLLVTAQATGGAVEITGDHVPADPALRQMVERRHPPREGKGRLIGQSDGDAEAQMARRLRHGRHQEQRVVDRHLDGVLQRGIGGSAEHVIDAEHIGEEQAVELSPLQRLRQLHPVIEPCIILRPVARMLPQSRRLMRDAIHLEGVEADLFRHE